MLFCWYLPVERNLAEMLSLVDLGITIFISSDAFLLAAPVSAWIGAGMRSSVPLDVTTKERGATVDMSKGKIGRLAALHTLHYFLLKGSICSRYDF